MNPANDCHHLADGTPNNTLVKRGRAGDLHHALNTWDILMHKKYGTLCHKALVQGSNARMLQANPLIQDRSSDFRVDSFHIVIATKTIQLSVFSIDDLKSGARVPERGADTVRIWQIEAKGITIGEWNCLVTWIRGVHLTVLFHRQAAIVSPSFIGES
jgi:hypothetical protein